MQEKQTTQINDYVENICNPTERQNRGDTFVLALTNYYTLSQKKTAATPPHIYNLRNLAKLGQLN